MAKKKASKKAPKKVAKKTTVATPKKRPTRAQRLAAARREIEKRNKRFKAADAAGKRVLIAQDVIDQIKRRKIQPARGTWVGVPYYFRNVSRAQIRKETQWIDDRSVREDFLTGVVGKCECCALGAMFMSCTLNNNKTTFDDLNRVGYSLGDAIAAEQEYGEEQSGLENGITKFFPYEQLIAIEQAFEGGKGKWTLQKFDEHNGVPVPYEPNTFEQRLLDWSVKYPKPRDRLLAIMRNIVDNNGTFKP